jgi:serine/threonine-protein kinase
MIPSKIGRYAVKRKLAEGGMATILLAHDPQFKRDVAIKLLPQEYLHDTTFRARFQREGEIIASLEVDGIVQVYDYGEHDGQPYFVMRYMPGGSLAERIIQGPLPVAEAARIVAHIAPALDQAHQQGVIHRDLKPANILFDKNNDPFVSDFGIAKMTERRTVLTAHAMTIGTPDYMSPEQARGEAHLDGRSDVYALGVMLFEMLTGQLPFNADTPLGMAYQHVNEPLPHLLDKRPTLPPETQAIIEKALAKKREDRYPTVTALAEALAVVARKAAAPPKTTLPDLKAAPPSNGKQRKSKNSAVTARPPTNEVKTLPLRKRRLWFAALGAAALLVIAGAVGVAALAVSSAGTAIAPGLVPETTIRAAVIVDNAHVRAGPGTEYDSLEILSEGAELEVTGRTPDRKWLSVTLPDERAGWIAASTVETSIPLYQVPELTPTPPA